MMILSIVATVVLLGALFYHRVSLLLSSVILLAWTAALGAAGVWNIWLLLPLAIILLPFNFAPMRKSMISAPAFRTFRKVMPPMSRTEKEAIDAGTTWWEGDLFRGNPDWQKLHNYPQPRLTAEEQAFLDGPVEEACRMANDFAITHHIRILSCYRLVDAERLAATPRDKRSSLPTLWIITEADRSVTTLLCPDEY